MGSPLVVPLLFMMLILSFSFPQVLGLMGISSTSSVPGVARRNLLQITNNVSESWSMKHSSDETVRADPLDNLNKYRDGYNITNKHYWSSTIFTGIYGYAIGALWLFLGIVYGGSLLATKFCCRSREKKGIKPKKSCYCYGQSYSYLCPILLATFFTILAIVASGLVFRGNNRFHSEAKSMMNIVMETAEEASRIIYNTTGAMKDMSNKLGSSTSSSSSDQSESFNAASSFLTSTSQKLDVEAEDIQSQAKKNRRLIDRGLKIVYIITTVIISLNLTAAVTLSASGILRLRQALYLFILLCWFLTALCWSFFGLYFFLHKFSNDTCTALEGFQENPNNNSLSSIVPCDELLSAKPVLVDISSGIYNLVNQVNSNISESYPNFAFVCNPFSAPPEYQYQPENCAANSIRIGDIPKVLEAFTCFDDTNEACGNQQFISSNNYKTVEAYTSSIQELLNVYPEMESLVECEVVKEAFSKILIQHCKPLKKYVHTVWAAMLFLSVVMVFLVLVWTIKGYHEQKNHFSDGSVNPHSATTIKNNSNPSLV